MRVKASDALIAVGGHLVETADSLEELKVRLFIIATAWNFATECEADRKTALGHFLDERKSDAPEASSIDQLEFEMRRIMREKRRVYPNFAMKILAIDAVERAENDYVVRASFELE